MAATRKKKVVPKNSVDMAEFYKLKESLTATFKEQAKNTALKSVLEQTEGATQVSIDAAKDLGMLLGLSSTLNAVEDFLKDQLKE